METVARSELELESVVDSNEFGMMAVQHSASSNQGVAGY